MKTIIDISDNDIENVATIISLVMKKGNKLMVCGNGGSAEQASHFVGELVCKYLMDREGFPAISLNTNASVITAWSNDMAYESVFARQVQALGKKGDVIIGITTSGGSQNIINALLQAKEMGITTIIFTGDNYSRLHSEWIDYAVIIPSKETPRIQESHLVMIHEICKRIEEMMTEAKP
jgi:D-sedoheptulose 7-phosphate isomerase